MEEWRGVPAVPLFPSKFNGRRQITMKRAVLPASLLPRVAPFAAARQPAPQILGWLLSHSQPVQRWLSCQPTRKMELRFTRSTQRGEQNEINLSPAFRHRREPSAEQVPRRRFYKVARRAHHHQDRSAIRRALDKGYGHPERELPGTARKRAL